MLNPFSISLAVQLSKIYSRLCLNEGSSSACPAPLIVGEKARSHPTDTRLTVQFPSQWDAWPLPCRQSPPPLQPRRHLRTLLQHGGCSAARHPVLRHPLVPTSCAGSRRIPGTLFRSWVPCRHAPLPVPVMHGRVLESVQAGEGRAGSTTTQCCKFLSAGAVRSQALIMAVLQGSAWRGWIPGSGQAPRASRAPKTALMYFDRTSGHLLLSGDFLFC